MVDTTDKMQEFLVKLKFLRETSGLVLEVIKTIESEYTLVHSILAARLPTLFSRQSDTTQCSYGPDVLTLLDAVEASSQYHEAIQSKWFGSIERNVQDDPFGTAHES